jgi:hypothetical protein
VLPSGSVRGTLSVFVPNRYVTQTTTTDLGNGATAPITSTIRPNSANDVGTILTEIPLNYATITVGTDEGNGGSVTYSSTISASDGGRTYLILTPYPYSTYTTSYDNGVSGTVTIITTISVTNSAYGSVITSTPGIYLTSTTGYDAGPAGGSTITSVASAAANPNGIGTEYISTPYLYITTISSSDVGPSGTVPPPTTSIVSAATAPSNTGTVISIVSVLYKTNVVPYQGSGVLSAPITSVTPPANGETTGNVGITTQAPAITSYTGYDEGPGGSDVITSTSTGAGVAPTFYVSTPYPYVTTTSGSDQTATFTVTQRPTGSNTVGSIIVYTKFVGPTVVITSFFTSGTTYTSTIDNSGTATDTILVGYLQTFVTTTTTSGTIPATNTIAQPSGTIPGTVQVVIATPVQNCGNQGVQYAIQTNVYPRGLARDDPTYSQFRASAFQTEAPQATGVTRFFEVDYVARGGSGSIYGNPPEAITQLGVNHKGYLYGKVGGEFVFNFPISVSLFYPTAHTFSPSQSPAVLPKPQIFLLPKPLTTLTLSLQDDISLLWLGPQAIRGYTRANANVEQLYNGSSAYADQQRIEYRYTIAQGQYVPLRVLWANWLYDGEFRLNVTAPDGELVTNGDGTASPYLVQFSCDGIAAPPFPAWGNEA